MVGTRKRLVSSKTFSLIVIYSSIRQERRTPILWWDVKVLVLVLGLYRYLFIMMKKTDLVDKRKVITGDYREFKFICRTATLQPR